MINKDQAGFTLAELLIVISLIGVLLIMVMVNFKRGDYSTNLRQAGNALMQDFRKAQSYSISGNSIKYCAENSTDNEYYPCQADTYCQAPDGSAGDCKLSVPGGGYGIMVASTENYLLFADTYFEDNSNPESPEPHNYFDSNIMDYEISSINYSLDGIHINEYKLGDDAAVVPNDGANRLEVLFSVPEGKTKFYKNMVETLENKLEILIASDYISNTCRKITINRVTGQVSEGQSTCNL